MLAVVALLGGRVARGAPTVVTIEEESKPKPGEIGPKDPDVALGLSTGITLAGVAALVVAGVSANANDSSEGAGFAIPLTVGLVGVVLGPTTGHWYSGKVAHTATAVRLVGALAGFVGAYLGLAAAFNGGSGAPGVLFMVGGAVTYVGGTVWEIAAAPDSARAYNLEHERAKTLIVPTVLRGGAGVGLVTTF